MKSEIRAFKCLAGPLKRPAPTWGAVYFGVSSVNSGGQKTCRRRRQMFHN
jgi:hypothetical protein